MALQLNILTLNIWGIPYISKDREKRVEAISEALATGDYDVVSLQEVWSENDYQTIKARLANILSYSHYFYNGVFGSGLCVFSKYPIERTFYHGWRLNGYIHRIQHGDWFGGKGVGLVKLNVNDQYVNLYVAHLHAEYNKTCDEYKTHRIIQAFDTAQFIEATRGDCVLQILAGDLNTEPGDIAQRILLTTSRMHDSFVEAKETKYIGTNECAKNSYSIKELEGNKPEGIRIDYVMFHLASHFKLDKVEYELPFPDRVPNCGFSYSDHEAVHVKIKISRIHSSSEEKEILKEYANMTEMNKIALSESIKICEDSLKQLNSDRNQYIMVAITLIVLLLNMIELQAPYGLKSTFIIFKILLTALTLFFMFMASIWNIMERHSILSGKLSMEVALKSIEKVTH